MLLIYGKGKVGNAVRELCEYRGISYEICDESDAPGSFDAYESIIPSPGVPAHHSVYQSGKVFSELDFAYQFLPKDFEIISVTGTDGKSTTSWIMYSILKKEYNVKKSVYLSGNFDIPFSSTILEILKKGEKEGIIVVEISSFMGFLLRKFESDYSIFTNFKRDHQNWHSDLQDYLDAKMQVILRTKKKAFINEQVKDFAKGANLIFEIPQNASIFSSGKNGEDFTIDMTKTQFSGDHNMMNISSVLLVLKEMEIPIEHTREHLKTIKGLPHRLEVIGEKNGITFVEDSKSTSSQSLEAALSSFGDTKNLLLIVGGSDKGDSFEYLAPKFSKRVKAMACIGTTKHYFEKIAKNGNIPFLLSDSLSESVGFLFSKGESGDILMLSPGCASFGLFRDYLDRANQFREVIETL